MVSRSVRKIMLVDDEERLLVTTRMLFEKLGVETLTAGDGETALRLLDANDVEVVFLDVKMPGMNGLATLVEIKRLHPLTEVVLITGAASMDDVVEGLRLGALDYLVKPASVKELLSKAERAFEKRLEKEEMIRSALCGRGSEAE